MDEKNSLWLISLSYMPEEEKKQNGNLNHVPN
jgi:hypothetical protein